MSNTVNKYATAIVEGNIREIASLLSTAIKVLPPGAPVPNEGKDKNSMMLSAVAAVVNDFKSVHIFEGNDGWSAVSLEGTLDGTAVQFIDNIHVDENDLVVHVDICLQPAPLAQSLLAKVTEEIGKRTKS